MLPHGCFLDTDQIECYDEHGRKTPCAGTGQDADGKSAGGFQEVRFGIQNEVVVDELTGLRWTLNANLFDYPLTWDEARIEINQMNAKRMFGHHSWKLPSRRELFSIISHQNINPSLPKGYPFANVFPGYYWTETACARLPDEVWYIHLGGGRIYRGSKRSSYLVWPVCAPSENRSAHPVVPGRPAYNAGAMDLARGLMWSKDADLAGASVSWQAALDTVERLNREQLAGFGDWRLPNIRELESLTDTSAHTPALPTGHPFQNVRQGYWSSTTSMYEPRYAWVLYTRDGAVGVGYKVSAEFNVWAVRSTSAKRSEGKRRS